MDSALPIPMGHNQTISQPSLVQAMTALLNPRKDERVLEIGTGSGYQTSILAKMVGEVHTIEVYKDLSQEAKRTCDNLGIKNIKFYAGDGSMGLAKQGPFDIIIVTAGAPEIPKPLLQQLKDGGRLLIPIRSEGFYNLSLVVRQGKRCKVFNIKPTVWVPLVGKYGWKNIKLDQDADLSEPKPLNSTTHEASEMLVKAEAERIHTENIKYTPPLATNTVLCHIAAPSTLPDGQQGMLNRLDSGMRGIKYSEKMLELKTDNSSDFIEQVKDTIQRAQKTYREVYGKDYANYTFKFDVACPSLDLVARVQNELKLPALAFAPQNGEGNMVQVENIMLALRALEQSIETGNIKSLIDAYTFVTGNKINLSIKDIVEFAKTMLFAMPKMNVNELCRINTLIEENIKTAA